jgi:hypothetical protein
MQKSLRSLSRNIGVRSATSLFNDISSKKLLYFANAWGWVLAVCQADCIGKDVRAA